ncbi:MAG: DUF2062 domain-containing protein [Alphaproteobacteria bacterium]
MAFGRLNEQTIVERAREFLVPMGSYARWLRYLRLKVQRLPGTPHAIAFGFACGTFASFTPLVGFHFIIAGLISWLLGGSILASAFGTIVGNPWTFPFIWLSTYRLGQTILGRTDDGDAPDATQLGEVVGQADSTSFMASFTELIVPMMTGGVPLGLAAGFVAYLVLRPIVATYQSRRRDRLARKRKRKAARAEAIQANEQAQSND